MRTLNGKRRFFLPLATVALCASLTGCGLMHDDLEDCATRPSTHTSVRFVYDYNTQASDMFNDHVGAVTLFVFDQSGKYLREIEKPNPSLGNTGRSNDFKIDLDLEPGKYNVYAVAQGHPCGYASSLNTPGAKFRLPSLSGGDPLENYIINLDHSNGFVDNKKVPMDTLWTTLTPQVLDVPAVSDPVEGDAQLPDNIVEATIPLMRVTNHVAVSFWQTDFPTDIDPDYYDIKIEYPGGNHSMDIHGTLRKDVTTVYTPYAVKTERRTIDGRETACITADFGISRLMLEDNARLIITNRNTGFVTTVNNIPRILAKGREAYSSFNWGEQEYLDREYEYPLLEFALDDPIPKWVKISIEILSWSKRIQNTEL